MKRAATIARSLQADMQSELREIERAVTSGTRDAGRGLTTELRRQVTSAGLGPQLANSWRDRHYPNQKLDAASLVYTKASQIIRAFDEARSLVASEDAFWRSHEERTRGQADQPEHLPEHRFGPLRFVPRQSGPSLVVANGFAPHG